MPTVLFLQALFHTPPIQFSPQEDKKLLKYLRVKISLKPNVSFVMKIKSSAVLLQFYGVPHLMGTNCQEELELPLTIRTGLLSSNDLIALKALRAP